MALEGSVLLTLYFECAILHPSLFSSLNDSPAAAAAGWCLLNGLMPCTFGRAQARLSQTWDHVQGPIRDLDPLGH